MSIISIVKVITDLMSRGKKLWFDVDGTIVQIGNRNKLTELGEYLRDNHIPVTCLTVGGHSTETLAELGIDASEVVTVGPAMIQGLYDPDAESKTIPDDEYLIDDQDHPLSKNVIKYKE